MRCKAMEDLTKVAEKALQQVADKGDLTPAEADAALKAVCLLEKIWKYQHIEEITMGEDFEDMYSSMGTMPDPMHDEWVSRTGRMRSHYPSWNIRRSGMYDDARSGHSITDRAIDSLEKMMDEAKSTYEKDQIKEMIKEIRKKQYE